MSDVTSGTTTTTTSETSDTLTTVLTDVAEAAPVVEAVATAPSPTTAIETLLGGWLDNYVRNSPIAQSTPAWNHLIGTALPALTDLLVKGL